MSAHTPTPRTLPGTPHEPAACKKDRLSIDFHTKSYSFDFICPVCHGMRRANTNYVGSRRHLVCDGVKIRIEAIDARVPKLRGDDACISIAWSRGRAFDSADAKAGAL